MITKLLIMLALFGGTILIMVVIWRRFYATGKSNTLSDEMILSWVEALSRLELERRQLRRWAGQRSLTFRREPTELARALELELIDGFFEDYLRVHLEFETPLEQGVSILTEGRLGLVSTLLRSREVRLGQKQLDRKFVLLAQEEERLRALLAHNKLRDDLILLQEQVDELVLTDESLFVLLSQIPTPQECVELLRLLDMLASKLVAAAAILGPIAQPGAMDYTEVMNELGTREEVAATSQSDLEALQKPDPLKPDESITQVVELAAPSDEAETSSVTSASRASSPS